MTRPEAKQALSLLRQCPAVVECCEVFEWKSCLNGQQVCAMLGTELFGCDLLYFRTLAEAQQWAQSEAAR